MSGPQPTQSRPIGQPAGIAAAQQQSTTPHIPMSGDQFASYRIQAERNRSQSTTPEHLRHSEIEYTEARHNPAGVAPDIPVVTTPLNVSNTPSLDSLVGTEVVGSAFSLADGTDPLEAIAAMAEQMGDQELATLARGARDERTVLAQGVS